jgi:4-hydroxy-4-methyl-2-oxoglutarate aldolase
MSAENLTEAQLLALRSLDACTVANAIETFHERLRNEGFADPSIRSLFPEFPPLVGYAATLKIRGSSPPTASAPYADRTDWWDYVLTLPTPRVLVIQDVATHPGLCSLVGEVHMSILQALQCIGVVTNGAVRDVPAARREHFHYFAGGVAVSHGYIHVVEFGQPVKVGGLAITSGDLLHGDQHGVQTVPLDIAAQVPAAAQRIVAAERALIELCRTPQFSLEALRAALASHAAPASHPGPTARSKA